MLMSVCMYVCMQLYVYMSLIQFNLLPKQSKAFYVEKRRQEKKTKTFLLLLKSQHFSSIQSQNCFSFSGILPQPPSEPSPKPYRIHSYLNQTFCICREISTNHHHGMNGCWLAAFDGWWQHWGRPGKVLVLDDEWWLVGWLNVRLFVRLLRCCGSYRENEWNR